jgi:RNA polymerase sigma-70 factor (ECF subfamily)
MTSDFGRLLEAEIPHVRQYARSLTRDNTAADDLVQDCLERALAKQDLWQKGNLRGWLITILHNLYINQVRRNAREGISTPIEQAEEKLIARSNPFHCVQLLELEKMLALLPEEHREVLLLVGVEGLRYNEAADILGIPAGTVRSRLMRCRETLRMRMDPDTISAASPKKCRGRPQNRFSKLGWQRTLRAARVNRKAVISKIRDLAEAA